MMNYNSLLKTIQGNIAVEIAQRITQENPKKLETREDSNILNEIALEIKRQGGQ